MKTGTLIHRAGRLLAVSGALAAVAPWASAGPSWDFVSSACTASGSTVGNSYSCNSSTSGTPAVVGSAWSTTGSGSTFAQAQLALWSGGFGVQTGTIDSGTPNHSLDNFTYTDALLLNFNQNVFLDQVKIGWWQTDSDISVLRYTGSTAPTFSPAVGVSGLTTAAGGWQLAGHYANVAAMANMTADINATASSSWWLVSAYNSNYGSNPGWTFQNDYVKILGVAATVDHGNQVSEPGSLALAGMALLGAFGTRRRFLRKR